MDESECGCADEATATHHSLCTEVAAGTDRCWLLSEWGCRAIVREEEREKDEEEYGEEY